MRADSGRRTSDGFHRACRTTIPRHPPREDRLRRALPGIRPDPRRVRVRLRTLTRRGGARHRGELVADVIEGDRVPELMDSDGLQVEFVCRGITRSQQTGGVNDRQCGYKDPGLDAAVNVGVAVVSPVSVPPSTDHKNVSGASPSGSDDSDPSKLTAASIATRYGPPAAGPGGLFTPPSITSTTVTMSAWSSVRPRPSVTVMVMVMVMVMS